MSTEFHSLSLSADSLKALDVLSYHHATPVQAGSIPHALQKKDLMVQSQTGTGKTAAFALPIIELLALESHIHKVSALVLTPTRELARQVMQEFNNLAQFHALRICAVYGGTDLEKQITEIQRSHIIIATPGRLIDHIKRKNITLQHIKHFVLDEADEMLNMGFAEELDFIIDRLPHTRHTLFFSATFPQSVKYYAHKMLQDPLMLSFIDESSTADTLSHYYYTIHGLRRTQSLVQILQQEAPQRAMIFVNTRRASEHVAQALKKSGFVAERLSGDMDQKKREVVMKEMKNKKLPLLVATDIAARGIDISQLTHVIHYDMPQSSEAYVHRSGRTGRAGNQGIVISLLASQDVGLLYKLKQHYQIQFEEKRLIPQTQSSQVQSTKSTTRKTVKAKTPQVQKPRANTPRSQKAQAKIPRVQKAQAQKPQAQKSQVTRRKNTTRKPVHVNKLSHPQKVYVNLGHQDHFTPSILQDVLATLSGLLPTDILSVNIKENHSTFHVQKDFIDDFIIAVHGETLDQKVLKVRILS